VHQDVTCAINLGNGVFDYTYALVGCSTYNNADGKSQDEGMYGAIFFQDYYDPKYFYCQTWSKTVNGPVGIAGRCCKSTSNKAVLKSESTQGSEWNVMDVNCNRANACDADAGAVMTGCSPVYMNPGYTGGYADDPTGSFIGDDGKCYSGRMDAGRTSASTQCVVAKAGGSPATIDCYNAEKERDAVWSFRQEYVSFAPHCEDGYEAVDCNGYIKGLQGQCENKITLPSYSTTYGSYWFQYPSGTMECRATGSENIRAQIRCCRIDV